MDKKYFIVNKGANGKAQIMLYGYIGSDKISANIFATELRALEKEYTQVDVRINSAGGSVFEGVAIYNVIKNSTLTIDTYIDGLAASMGSIIGLAGRKVYMSRMAKLMTHEPSNYASGTATEMRRNAELLDDIAKTMLSIYAEKTGKTEDECKGLYMNGKDNWFNATQALADGLVDGIYDASPVKAPAASTNEKMAYEEYAMQLIDLYNPEINDMKQYKMTAGQLAQMKLTETSPDADVTAAIDSLISKAEKVDSLTAELQTANQAKTKAEADLEAYKKQDISQKVKDLCAQLVTDTKATKEQAAIYEKTYANDFDALKALAETLRPYQSVTATLAAGDAGSKRIGELMAMTGSELFSNGGFDELKALSPTDFDAKWKQYTEGK